eukprot:244887-Heterocapsa_arctica.AAC.1
MSFLGMVQSTVPSSPSKSRLPRVVLFTDVYCGLLDGHLLNELCGGLPKVEFVSFDDPDAGSSFLPPEFRQNCDHYRHWPSS